MPDRDRRDEEWDVIGVLRLLLAWALIVLATAPARADDVSAASRSVVRVVVVQFQDGEIVDFGHGSGLVVGPNRVVTNAHVVALGATEGVTVAIGIVPSEGSESFGARIVAFDAARDLALLEMEEGALPPVTIFTGALDAGTAVAALGYPGNVDMATARSMQDYIRPLPPTRSMGNYSDMRQGDAGPTLVHTADIARGHSGGPLVDACGRVIGVNRMITRNEMGDSTFGFAIPVNALVDFLRGARQPFRSVAGECVSQEARQRADAQRADQQRRAREADEATRLRGADERRSQRLAALQEDRENRLGIAVLLLVLSLAAMGVTFVLMIKDRHRPAIVAGFAAAALLLGAAVTFFTRPSLTASQDGPDQADASATAASFEGANRCRLDPERSRVTVSAAEEVDLNWQEGGCVNGNTQYARAGERWRRVLVPNEEQTVTVSEFDPEAGEYQVSRYLLGAAAMTRARQLRQRVEQKACTGDADALATLAARQRELAAALPRTPNERLVYRCGPGGGAS